MPLPLVSHFGNHSPVNGAPVLMAFKCPTPVLSPSTTPSDLSCFCSCSATHSSLAMSIHGHRFAFLSFPFHSIPCHSNPIRLAFVGLAAFALWPLSQPGQVPFMWPEPASQPARSPAEIVAHIHTQQHCAATQNPFTLSFCRVCLWLTQWLKCLGLVFAFCLVFDWKTMAAPEWVGVRPDGGALSRGQDVLDGSSDA